jgi:hypothetical protein
MAYDDSGERPHHDLRYGITDGEAKDFLRQLADPDSELRRRLETENPRDVLLDYNLDIVGIPDTISLPPAEEIQTFNRDFLRLSDETNNVGYAILYFMLGAMPLVVADGNAAP